MNASPLIQVRLIAVPEHVRATGIRCFAHVRVGDAIEIDGLACRRTRGGKGVVTWPARRDASQRQHPVVTLLQPSVKEAVERAVLDAAERGGWITT